MINHQITRAKVEMFSVVLDTFGINVIWKIEKLRSERDSPIKSDKVENNTQINYSYHQ